jgi:hypothetical protein
MVPENCEKEWNPIMVLNFPDRLSLLSVSMHRARKITACGIVGFQTTFEFLIKTEQAIQDQANVQQVCLDLVGR